MKYKVKKPLLQKIGKQAEESIEGIIHRHFRQKIHKILCSRGNLYIEQLFTLIYKKVP